jgi:hypothetical protein
MEGQAKELFQGMQNELDQIELSIIGLKINTIPVKSI